MRELEYTKPAEIERRSMEIIEKELGATPRLSAEERTILKRVIHTTPDFDYKENLKFSKDAVRTALSALRKGTVIITDTNMALAGINKAALSDLGCEAVCFMADAKVAKRAEAEGVTRAFAAMETAAELYGNRGAIFAIGNAPTALLELCALFERGEVSPSLIIGAPVGFVNVEYAKEKLTETGAEYIAAMGRKGGSSVAAAICNALFYMLLGRG